MHTKKKDIPKKGVFLSACLLFSVFFVSSAQAQHLFDVGKKALPDVKGQALLEQVRQQKLATPPLGSAKASSPPVALLAGANRTTAGLVLLNEKTGQSIVLSGISEVCSEIKLTPLLIAELKARGLGEADVFRCILVDDVNALVPVVKNNFIVSGSTDGLKMPVFNYGPKDNIRSTAIGERTLIEVGIMKPRYTPRGPDDPTIVDELAKLAQMNSFYVYTYALPDGSQILITEPKATQVSNVLPLSGGTLTFQFNVTGGTQAHQDVLTYVGGLWGSELIGTVPVNVSVTFIYDPANWIAGCGFTSANKLDANAFYTPAPLANQISGYDLDGSNAEIELQINTKYDSSFYFGTDGNAGGQIDLVTIILHELTHGLGMIDSVDSATGSFLNTTPFIFDTFLYYNGSRLTNQLASTRLTAISSDALYYDGSNAIMANGGSRIKLYAPTTYQPGSSVSHWDQSVTFPTWMKYAYVSPLHTFGAQKLGLMKDLGWTLSTDVLRVIGLSGSLGFGNVPNGSTSTATLTIANTGSETLTVSSITYPAGFSGNWSSGAIAAGGSQNVTVTFAPAVGQLYSGTITVFSDKTSGGNTISCSGTGIGIVLNISSLNVPEGRTAMFQVKLSAQPAASTVVTVLRSAGDSDITVSIGSSLSIPRNSWNVYKNVTLAVAQDADTLNGTATITCSASGFASVNLTATEIDNDTTLTVIAGTGGTVSPSGATVVTTNVATTIRAITSKGYTFTNWTVTSGAVIFANINATNTTATLLAPATIQANWIITKTSQGTPYLWLDQYSLVTNANYTAADLTDTDKDGYRAWQEYVADTNPTNAASLFRIVAVSNLPPWKVYFEGSSTGRQYTLYWTTNLVSAGWTNNPSQLPIWGHGGVDALIDTNTSGNTRFYRLEVKIP